MTARPRPAFTLLEMVLSLSIMTVLLFAMGGAVILAARAVPDEAAAVQEVPRIGRGLERLLEDAAAATLILERTSQATTFLVPDRDGDGRAETIRYAWGGAGEPLTRRLNGGAEQQVIAALDSFALAADVRITIEPYPAPTIESGEIALVAQNATTPPWNKGVQDNNWWGQHFKPTLSAGTQSWSVTRVLFRVQQDSGLTDDLLNVELRVPEADGRPSSTILDSVAIPSSAIPNATSFIEAAFSTVEGLSPTSGLCLTFTAGSGRQPAIVYGASNVAFADGGLSRGSPDGWEAPDLGVALSFNVYGRTIGTGTAGSVQRTTIERLRVSALSGGEPSASLESATQLLNEPEVLSGYWEADFASDPTQLDVNGDGEADWHTGDGAAFDLLELDGGYWWALNELWTGPACNFDEPTLVEVRARNDVLGSAPGVVSLHVDRANDSFAVIEVTFERTGANAQQVEVRSVEADGTPRLLVDRSIGAGWFDLRCLVDTDGDVVSIRLDDADLGSFAYEHVTAVGAEEGIGLRAASGASGAQFDHVRITLGGSGTVQGADAAPVAVMTMWPAAWPLAGATVDFDGADSVDPEGGSLTYAWDFGDGGTGGGPLVAHVYDAPGLYTVTLTVTDGQGNSDAVEGLVEVR